MQDYLEELLELGQQLDDLDEGGEVETLEF